MLFINISFETNKSNKETNMSAFLRGALYINSNHSFRELNMITDVLDISPNYLWEQKKTWLKGREGIPQICWGYELPTRLYDSTNEPVNELLDIFLPKKNIFVPFVKENKLESTIDILIHIYEYDVENYDSEPCIVCEILPTTIQKLADLQVAFQITPRIHYGSDNSLDE
jgi:hypothetical protein